MDLKESSTLLSDTSSCTEEEQEAAEVTACVCVCV